MISYLCIVIAAPVVIALACEAWGAGRLAIGAVALTVAGCVFTDPKVEYVPYRQDVPVPVACAAPIPAEPEWATKDMPRVDPKTGENIDIAVKKQAAEIEQRKGYEDKMKAAVAGCQP